MFFFGYEINKIVLVLLMARILKQQFLEKTMQGLGIENVISHRMLWQHVILTRNLFMFLANEKDRQLMLVSFKMQ